jgi:hypothetical protein
MPTGRSRAMALFAVGLGALVIAVGALVIAPGPAEAQFQIGLQDPAFELPVNNPSARRADAAMRAINGSTIRLFAFWSAVAPGGAKMPSGFHPTDPADRKYNWSAVDAALRLAAQRGEHVVLTLHGAPAWAQPAGRPASVSKISTTWNPNPAAFGDFARAAALRYSGGFPDPLRPGATLPRVSSWEIWNEENLPYDLTAPDVVLEYRNLLNAAYGAIKSVRRDNLIAIGGLAPVSYLSRSVSPLKFAADLLCLRRMGTRFVRSRSCPGQAHFDVFAMHPYTLAATPTKHAYHYDDVLIGDLGKISSVVGAADRLHTAAPRIRHKIWVTEWGWFSNPPNKDFGDSNSTAARYVAYSMYEMWRSGVSLVIWLFVADAPAGTPANIFFFNGGGLYRNSGQPKLALRAFAFPVVAGVQRGRGFVWGRAPVSRRVQVAVERAEGPSWKRVATIPTGPDGVFYVKFRARGNGRYRARVVNGAVSLTYDSTPIPPRRTHLFYSG